MKCFSYDRCNARRRRSDDEKFTISRAKRMALISKRQTGTYNANRLPPSLSNFEKNMIKCEQGLSQQPDSRKAPFLFGDVRGGVIDAILTCQDQLLCNVDTLSATNAFANCSNPPSILNSAKMADEQLSTCLQNAI